MVRRIVRHIEVTETVINIANKSAILTHTSYIYKTVDEARCEGND